MEEIKGGGRKNNRLKKKESSEEEVGWWYSFGEHLGTTTHAAIREALGRPGRGVISEPVEPRPKTSRAGGQAAGLPGSWVSAKTWSRLTTACHADAKKMLKGPSRPVFSWSHWPNRR